MINKGQVVRMRKFPKDKINVKLVKTNELKFAILENVRTEPGDFESKYHCNLCDPNKERYTPTLIKLPGSHLRVCRDCICNMEEAMKAATLQTCGEGRDA
jgi:hypothetical protein